MEYDYIVIGSGSAGAIIASRLTEDPDCNVLLLEAGPDYPDLERLPDDVKYGYGMVRDRKGTLELFNKHRWTFVARATGKARPMLVPRGKVIGGSSSVNAQIFLRGVPEDYDTWASWGNSEWGFQKCLPYFRKLESESDFHDDFHGTEGPIIVRRFKPGEWHSDERAFYDACRSLGYPDCPDHNNPDSSGVGPTPLNNPNRIRWSTNIGYLSAARHRLNLTIRGNCLVRRVLLDGTRAVGVEVESGGEVFKAHGGEVIVCAGAIGSPHLLMLSGIGPAAHLRKAGVRVLHELPGVGQNLRDHPQVHVTWRTKADFKQDPTAARIQMTLRYTASGSHLRNDMLIHPVSCAMGSILRGEDPSRPIGIMMIPTLNLAVGVGEMSLRCNDPHVQPVLDYNFLQEEFDRQRLREAVRICLELAKHKDLARIIEERLEPLDADLASDDALDDWMMREVTTSHHISGTCKMGHASDPMAVVDQHGRVYGLEGLRVADASIMPDCIRANTNVTTMMIGEKIADLIRSGSKSLASR